jgi:polar amino acid transport system substrate-binding protein
MKLFAPAAAAVAIAAAVLSTNASGQETPFLPDDWQYGRHEDEGTLRYCVDPRDPEWEIAGDIGEAIAGALLLEPAPATVEDTIVVAGWDSLYRHLLTDCDLYFGFKLIPGAYPGWLALSRPYYEASYVLAVRDAQWGSLADIPPDRPIGSAIATTADFALIKYLEGLPGDRRWPRFPMGSNQAALEALHKGIVAAALVWGPAAWAVMRSDPVYADVRLISPAPLPVSTLGVGTVMLANETFLRTSVDDAIAALSADGTIEEILTEHGFPAAVVE